MLVLFLRDGGDQIIQCCSVQVITSVKGNGKRLCGSLNRVESTAWLGLFRKAIHTHPLHAQRRRIDANILPPTLPLLSVECFSPIHNGQKLRSSSFGLISIDISQISVQFDLQVRWKWISQSASILLIFFELHLLKSEGVADLIFGRFLFLVLKCRSVILQFIRTTICHFLLKLVLSLPLYNRFLSFKT